MFHIFLTPSPFGRGSIFGSYIVEGVMTALAAYYLALEAIANPRRRIWWVLAAAAALFFVLCISPGRTGIVVALALAVLLLFQTASRRLIAPGLLLIILVIGGVFWLSPEFNERVSGIVTGIQGSQSNSAATSTGIRMQFYTGHIDKFLSQPYQYADVQITIILGFTDIIGSMSDFWFPKHWSLFASGENTRFPAQWSLSCDCFGIIP